MKPKQRKNITVGLFVTMGFIIFVSAIYLVGVKENIFGSTITASAIFKDAKGLREGDKVRLTGINIGTVSSVGFMNNNQVMVRLSLEQDVSKFVKKDSKVTIANEGLMGSKIVMILPGSIDAGSIQENDTLSTIEQIDIDDIIREVNKSSENIAVVSEELISITKKINRGEGIFGKIFTDTTFTKNLDESSKNIAIITKDLVAIADKVNSGKGIVGKIFADTLITSQIDSAGENINQIAVNLMEITDKINRGEGVFGRLFTDTSLTSNIFTSSQNLVASTKNLEKLTSNLTNDSSALNLFVNDTAFADSLEILFQNLNISIKEITEAADAVDNSGILRIGSKKQKKKEQQKKELIEEQKQELIEEQKE